MHEISKIQMKAPRFFECSFCDYTFSHTIFHFLLSFYFSTSLSFFFLKSFSLSALSS